MPLVEIIDKKHHLIQPLPRKTNEDEILTIEHAQSSSQPCDVTYETKYDREAGAAEIQKYRQQRVRHVCEKDLKRKPFNLTRDPEDAFDVLRTRITRSYCNDDYKMIASYIYDIASTSWKEVYANLFDKSSLAFRTRHGKLNNGLVPLELDGHISSWVSAVEITKKLADYNNCIFVCHPLCRVINAYKDFFEDLDDESRETNNHRKAQMIAKRLNDAASEENGTPTISFSDFLQFIVDDKSFEGENRDVNWDHMYLSHRPCDHYFDFIGHMETLRDDIDYLFKILNIEKVVRFPFGHPIMNCTQAIFEEYFSPVTDDLFQAVVRKYEYDMKVFGYHVPCDVKDMIKNIYVK